MRLLSLIVFVNITTSFALDTLCTHPFYPPITYRSNEYKFYKYTPKYIPESMLQCFKILGTSGDGVLREFITRPEEEVIIRGLYEKGYRLRKEFCLEGFSSFTVFFHRRGIYQPYAMKTYILLCFHQYLNKEKIRWNNNKKLSLVNRKKVNKAWKKRFNEIIVDPEPRHDDPSLKVVGDYTGDIFDDPEKWLNR